MSVRLLPLLLALVPSTAMAWEDEWNASYEGAGGFVLDDAGVVGEGIGWLGFRADVALFRSLSRDVGLVFDMRLGTRDFGDFVVLGGVGGLLPVHEALPFLLEAGAGVDTLTGEGLWYGRLWWGSRSHNQLGQPYSVAVGIFVEYQRAISGDAPPMLLFGATVDAWVLCWPFLWLYKWATVDQGPEVV